MCLGHESSGVIVKLGPDVTKTRKLELGQRVALEPGVVCRVCEFCKAGQYEVSLLLHSQWGDGVRGGNSVREGFVPLFDPHMGKVRRVVGCWAAG
jgi:threonine dehydrogenase-like Zn-dependent dehydrogenase